MPIINIDNYPIIDTSRPQQEHLTFDTENAFWKIRDWSKYDYWYCVVKFGDAFTKVPLETIITTQLLEKIKKDNHTFLVIHNLHEAFHHIVEPLYQSLVIKHEIPPKKIILISESADIHQVVIEVAKRYSADTFQVEWSLLFEHQIQNEVVGRPQDFLPNYNTPHNRKFLNLNRRWRLHRIALVAFLKSLNLLDHGYVSLAPSDDRRSWKEVFPWLLNYYESDPYLYNLLTSNKEEILSLPPMYLDTDDLVTNRPELSQGLDTFYQQTFFSLVTETNCYTEPGWETGRFFSEKIFKPIAYRHPFILWSTPHSLELLRELGYKTYSTVIDESYDITTNDNERIKKILAEVSRLANMSNNEVIDFVKNTKTIAEFNFRKLMTRKIHCYKKL